MGFEKFGQSGYVSQTKVTPLISYLEKGIVAGTRCKKCKTLYFPPRADCLTCRSSDVEWVPIEGRAKLVTFTQVHFGPPAFEQSTPYLLGLAEFSNGLRVFAPISRDLDAKELKPNL
ncbi:MAG TPA: Zn-ribbon domain-containing OB-fold protein [Candidatus Bathyarchaeia archaeon]|nr:Zn-ribbon domain-containing OB-fold protein [Candidatus Bathyarchaeia archaeon]